MNTSTSFSWEDARIFLCVTKHKSFTAAAKILNLGQPTISRRIQLLEENFAVQLFVRGKYGADPTEDALALIPAAEQMSKWASEFDRLASKNNGVISGLVKIAAPPGIAVEQLAPFAATLKHHEPDIRLEVLSAIDYIDLSQGIADIAIRNHPPLEQGLVSLHKVKVDSMVMGAPHYIEKLSKPYSIDKLDWVTWGGKYIDLEPRPMLEKLIPNFTPAFSSDDYLVVKAAAEAGLGACIVNKAMGFERSSLVEIELDLSLPSIEFHIVCAKSMQHVARVNTVVKWLEASIGT